MKKYLLNAPKPDLITLDSLMAEMILDKALLAFRKEQLEQNIDRALRDGDKNEFLRLTRKLKAIN
jgi:uncharacterized protein YpiB (UPF0302 family)